MEQCELFENGLNGFINHEATRTQSITKYRFSLSAIGRVL
jgi:hypothetical protein